MPRTVARRRFSTLATAAVVAAWSAPAAAGAFATARYTGEHGHPTTDNATAIYFNPGAMTRGKGPRLLLDVNLVARSASFEKEAHPSDIPPPAGPAGEPDRYQDANVGKASLFNLLYGPTLGFIGDADALSYGILVHAPFGGAAGFDKNDKFEDDPLYAGPVDGTSRWHSITGSLRSIYLSPGVAYRITPQLSLGAAFNLIFSRTETIRAKTLTNDDDLVTEGRAKLVVSGMQWGFGAGVMFEAVKDELWLGLSYQSQPNVSGGMVLTGEQQTRFVRQDGGVQEGTEKADLTQTYPDIIRLGGSFRPQPQLELRLFGDYQRWSVLADQCVSPAGKACETGKSGRGINGSTPLQNARRNWNDTLGVRAGASYWTNEDRALELFGGLGFDGNAVPDETLEPAIADANKLHVAAGARFALGDTTHFAASYTHLHYLPRDTGGKSIHSGLEGASKAPDSGGKYESWVGLLNVNLEVGF